MADRTVYRVPEQANFPPDPAAPCLLGNIRETLSKVEETLDWEWLEEFNPNPSLILKDNYSCDPDRDHGIWDANLDKWKKWPCRKTTCPRHWRVYAAKRYYDIRPVFETRNHWYTIRLTLPLRLVKGKRFQGAAKWRAKVKDDLSDAIFPTVYHRGSKHDHIHVLLGTDLPLDRDTIRDAWQAHCPQDSKHKWSKTCYSLREHDNPKEWLKYCTFTKERVLRAEPPWANIPLRSPIQFWA